MSTSGERKGFLDLPQELRDQIYGYTMLKAKTHITMLPHYSCSQWLVSAAQPAFCYVNKQIRKESLPIFYCSNLFLAELSDETDLATAKNWLAAIGDENVRHLKRLALCGWTKVTFEDMDSRLWLRIVLDLKDGTVEIEGNVAKFSQTSDVVKNTKELEVAYASMVAAKGEAAWDADGLGILMDGFHWTCMSE